MEKNNVNLFISAVKKRGAHKFDGQVAELMNVDRRIKCTNTKLLPIQTTGVVLSEIQFIIERLFIKTLNHHQLTLIRNILMMKYCL